MSTTSERMSHQKGQGSDMNNKSNMEAPKGAGTRDNPTRPRSSTKTTFKDVKFRQ